jgi:hypothetical protein
VVYRSLLAVVLLSSALLVSGGPDAAAHSQAQALPVLQRFFATDDSSPTAFRARRHLEAKTAHLGMAAWMDVFTEGTATGFNYTILGEGGSGYIRSHVFKSALDTEGAMWQVDAPGRSITPNNYTFDERGSETAGLVQVGVTPKRKAPFLLEGFILLRPDDGDLVTMEGLLTKNPSFWTRHVEVVGHFERIAGVRLPVAFESTASIVLAGTSTFTMTYDYEMVNGHQTSHKN